jgi:CheY-like chemotaxis protein
MAKEILIAESEKAEQQKFEKIFETTDYHLVFSESGEDVLLRVKLFKPDLIIAGTALSEKNGFELCEAIKGDTEFKSIPFVLLLDVFEEIPEKDRKRLKPDGILSKPLHEGEVLNMVGGLLEGMKGKGEGMSEGEKGWGSLTDMKIEDFLSEESGKKGEEEIIELMDVVEEPEPRMSINDFAIPGKEEAFGEIASLESWEKIEGEEKLAAEEGFVLSIKEEMEEREKIPVGFKKEVTPKRAPQEEELFEKIELEDILQKAEQMQPSAEIEEPLEKGIKLLEEEPPMSKEFEESSLGLEEFEALLKKGVEAEPPKEEAIEEILQSISIEEPKMEVPKEITPIEMPEEELEELAEEEFPKGLLEEALEEAKVGAAEELEEEEIGGLEEELESLEEEEIEGLEAEELEVVEEPKGMEELKEEKIELFEELEAPKVSKEEIRIVEQPQPIRIEKPEEVEATKFFEDAVGVPSRRMDHKIDEVISERVRTMMEEFITKHVPEMTKDIIGLTLERIEKMVKEIVPDLAEKMIEEEIKRLEKGEMD